MTKLFGPIVVVALGLVLRAGLYASVSSGVRSYLTTSIETMSPVTSYPRIVEGKFLVDSGIDAYASGYFKVNPLVASLVFPFVSDVDVFYWFLVAVDTLTAVLLMSVTENHKVMAGTFFYLFPYTFVSELGLSIGSVDMLLAALFLFSLLRLRKLGIAALSLALLVIVKPISTVTLVFPAALWLRRPVLHVFGSVALLWCLLQIASFTMTGSWSSFFGSFVDPLLMTPDLEPTMGMAWAIFSLIFPETVGLFRLIFHVHLFIIALPIYWRMREVAEAMPGGRLEGSLTRYVKLILAAALLYQAHPTAIDFAFIGSILIATDDTFHDKLSKIMSSGLMVGLAFTSAIAPVWLERNTGSPNFLFHFDIVTTFLAMLAVGQGLKVLRLQWYFKESPVVSPTKSVRARGPSPPPGNTPPGSSPTRNSPQKSVRERRIRTE